MRVQTTSSVAKLHPQAADELKPLINDPHHQMILSAEFGQAFGVPTTTPAQRVQGIHVVTASYLGLANLSDAERKALEKSFGHFKDRALDEIKEAYPRGNANVLGAKVVFGAIEHLSPWADPRKQSVALVSLEAAELLTDLVKVLKPSFSSLKKAEAICKFIGVMAQVGQKVLLYHLEHPAALTKT
jgi:hypothetical protein